MDALVSTAGGLDEMAEKIIIYRKKACWAHYGTKPLPQCCGRGFV